MRSYFENKGAELLFAEIIQHVVMARVKHERFAEGVYEALGILGEEYGEVVRAITKQEGEDRLREELLDLIAVAWRMLKREYEHNDQEEEERI